MMSFIRIQNITHITVVLCKTQVPKTLFNKKVFDKKLFYMIRKSRVVCVGQN